MARDIHAQSVPLPRFPMSAFDLGYSLKTCTQAGLMNCHYVEECIPGDIAHIRSDIFMRLDPMTFPIMHKVKIRQNFFFVPTRLILGDDLQREFFSYKDMASRLPCYVIHPPVQGILGQNTLFDMMECQPVSNAGTSAPSVIVRNPLPFLMYHKIWLDYYADEILQNHDIIRVERIIDDYRAAGLDGRIDVTSSTVPHPFLPRYASYSKDRFTSAQPDAQRVGQVYLMDPLQVQGIDTGTIGDLAVSGGFEVVAENMTDTDESLRLALTIDQLWDEMAVQRFLNSLNEFGNERYIEILAGQYGVISADARLQRAQWLGGNETAVNISEVLQTSQTSEDSPLGALAGRGIVSGRGRDIAFKVPEHGFIIGILTVVPENGYASGSPRWLYKSTPMDFALPRFNNLGEQAVYNGELFSNHLEGGSDIQEFGYQPQYDEYRSHPSRATCEFRNSQFLAWHLDRKFTEVPPLNEDFIKISPIDTNRIFNDVDEEAYHYRVHAFHKAMYVRPISKHPIPGKL